MTQPTTRLLQLVTLILISYINSYQAYKINDNEIQAAKTSAALVSQNLLRSNKIQNPMDYDNFSNLKASRTNVPTLGTVEPFDLYMDDDNGEIEFEEIDKVQVGQSSTSINNKYLQNNLNFQANNNADSNFSPDTEGSGGLSFGKDRYNNNRLWNTDDEDEVIFTDENYDQYGIYYGEDLEASGEFQNLKYNEDQNYFYYDNSNGNSFVYDNTGRDEIYDDLARNREKNKGIQTSTSENEISEENLDIQGEVGKYKKKN